MIELFIYSLSVFLLYWTAEPLIHLRAIITNRLSDDKTAQFYIKKLMNCEICSSFWLWYPIAYSFTILPSIVINGFIFSALILVFAYLKNKMNPSNDF